MQLAILLKTVPQVALIADLISRSRSKFKIAGFCARNRMIREVHRALAPSVGNTSKSRNY